MKALLEVVKFNVSDVITTSTEGGYGTPEQCGDPEIDM